MFDIARKKLLGVFRGISPSRRGHAPRNDDAYLRSSKANESRLNAAIAELDDGRGTLTTQSELRNRLREATAR